MSAKWKCKNGCDCETGLVCGGDQPYVSRMDEAAKQRLRAGDEVPPNIYFHIDLDGTYTRRVESDLPFALTDQDWRDMHSHADGGCCAEPVCPECKEALVRA